MSKDTEDVKILIVDDDPRNLDALEVMLESSGCSFVRAQSGDEALIAMLRHNFAAIILDIRMPGMNGIELAHLVKQRRRTRDVPILFLTAHLVDDADVLRGYGVGGVDYLSKPLNADILRSKVAVFVELFRKTRQLAAINAALQTEVVERHRAQQALAQANQELELRVAERTAALTVAHRGVRENEERLRLAMDVAQMAAWEWDVATDQMTWSTDPEALFGFPAGSFGPQLRIRSAVHPDDRARVDAALSKALSDGLYECEYRVLRPAGSVVWVTERGQVLRRPDGSLDKIVGVSRDVSAQRRAEQEGERLLIRERAARDEAERQSRFKDEFLATLSHELRTPINAILGWLSILARGEAVRDPAKAIEVIQRNAQMQAKLIEDLLEMNKLTSGTARLDVALVDVKTTVESALQALQPTAEAKGVHINASIDPAVPQMTADARRLQQVIWNLVHNAIKFTPDKGRVDVAVTWTSASVQIRVADTGQGIPTEFLPYVFDRFRQADSSATRGAWGLGIGLSIAKHIVELHGGTITAESGGPGQGATFLVQLPASRPAVTSAEVLQPTSMYARPTPDDSARSASHPEMIGVWGAPSRLPEGGQG
jgi:PAS domain S-box-containing protein